MHFPEELWMVFLTGGLWIHFFGMTHFGMEVLSDRQGGLQNSCSLDAQDRDRRHNFQYIHHEVLLYLLLTGHLEFRQSRYKS